MATHWNFAGCWLGLAFGVLGFLMLAAAPAWAGEKKIYTSERYGYGLYYPEACSLKAMAQGAYIDLSFQGKRLPTISIEWIDETEKAERGSTSDLWREFMVERAKLSCDADGPDGTVYCKGVEREHIRKTASGLRIIELYLRKVEESYGPPVKLTSSTVGPVHAVDISRNGYIIGLLIGSGHNYPSTPAEKEIIDEIVTSVHLIPENEFQPPKPRIVTPGPLFEGTPGRTLLPRRGM